MTKTARTIAALRAHKTRAEQQLRKTRSRKDRAELRKRIGNYVTRIWNTVRRPGRKATRHAA